MNQSEKYINACSSSLPKVLSIRDNAPKQFADRHKQYMSEARTLFEEDRAYLSMDYVHGRIQGLDPDDFFKWTEVDIRLSNVSTQSVTAFDSKNYDDFKEIMFSNPKYAYVPQGALLETMGSIWMVTNPDNMSNASPNTVIARCRSHFCMYDDYGNVVAIPLVIDRRAMLSNRNEHPQNIVIPEGYFNVKVQANKFTLQLNDNSRIILGKSAYHLTGFTDFFEEFTYDVSSCHVITFAIRREQPQQNDDVPHRIADGLLFTWSAELVGNNEISVGTSTQLTPHMLKNSVVMPTTKEAPQTWIFTSSDETVATVDLNGIVSGVSDGEVTITATLQENPNLTASMNVVVEEAEQSGIEILTYVPPTLRQYDDLTIKVRGYGDVASVPMVWSFSGADENDYTAEVNADGTECILTCDSPSSKPLNVEIKANDYTKTINIILEGY